MTIILYRMFCERNVVDKTSHLSVYKTLNGTLREETGILAPSIVIEWPENDTDTIPMCNYAYIADFGRVYFIDRITAVGNRLFRLDMTVDVLHSWKDYILQQTGTIERQETIFNPLLPDPLLPTQSDVQIVRAAIGEDVSPFKVKYGETGSSIFRSYVMIVSNNNLAVSSDTPQDLSEGPIVYPDPKYTGIGKSSDIYVLDYQALPSVINAINSSTIWDAITGSQYKAPPESVVSIIAYPFDLVSHDPGSCVQSHASGSLTKWRIVIGNTEITGTGTSVDPGIIYKVKDKYNRIFDLGSYTFPDTGDFTSYTPYQTIRVYLPYIGWRDLSPLDVVGHTVKFRYLVEITTGACTAVAYLSGGSQQIVLQESGQIGIQIPMLASNAAQVAQNNQSIAINTTMTAISAALGVATGNPLPILAGVKTAADAVGTATNNRMITRGSNYSTSLAQMLPDHVIVERYKEKVLIPTSFASTTGRLLKQTATLSSLVGKGLTVVGDIHLENFPVTYGDEVDRIEAALHAGVIL